MLPVTSDGEMTNVIGLVKCYQTVMPSCYLAMDSIL
jgi:hypothetical protein